LFLKNANIFFKQEKITRNLIRNAKKQFERRLADGGGQNKKPFYAYVKTKTNVRQSVRPLKTRVAKQLKKILPWQIC
jgi:hypothetical protein